MWSYGSVNRGSTEKVIKNATGAMILPNHRLQSSEESTYKVIRDSHHKADGEQSRTCYA